MSIKNYNDPLVYISLQKNVVGSYFNPESASHNNCRLLCYLLLILKVIFANNVDPDQTAPLGAL